MRLLLCCRYLSAARFHGCWCIVCWMPCTSNDIAHALTLPPWAMGITEQACSAAVS